MKNKVSSFWLQNDWDDDGLDLLSGSAVKPKKGKDPVKLAAYRRAVANFVRIVTGESIPVRFTTDGYSMTNGKEVIISATLDDKQFDYAVGLALHEGSHCKLTNFDDIVGLEKYIIQNSDNQDFLDMYFDKHLRPLRLPDYIGTPYDRNFAAFNHLCNTALKDLINIVEDRRIDSYIYRNAPGYRGYYQAMYDKYFNDNIIDKGLRSDEFRTEDWESYLFRIINITNEHRDLDALNALRQVWEILDLKNIDRIESTLDSIDIAWKIFQVVEQQIVPPAAPSQPGQGQDDDTSPESKDSQDSQDSCDANDDQHVDDDGSTAEGSEAIGQASDSGGNMLSDKQRDRLDRAIARQHDFIEGDVKKSRITKKINKQVQSMEHAGVEQHEVKYNANYYHNEAITTDVTIIRNFSRELINNVDSGMYMSYKSYEDEVLDGIRMGTMLGKKLKIRAEERVTKFNRRRSGKIDRRMIANAGFGAEAIFEKLESFAYEPGMIHVSIDNSGSMSGDKLGRSITTATAIAKACSMIDNMECIISFRAGSYVGTDGAWNQYKPTVLIAYNSRNHNMNELRALMPHVCSAGGTPEGLCFDAMMKEILKDGVGRDAYFVNFSDGMPAFNGYGGENAFKHTREQVKNMTKNGIKVLSYFIGNYGYNCDRDSEDFKAMYGKDASYIDVTKINAVANTMNEKFLQIN